ncbi:acyl-CoA dehydrogenase [Tomitella biformata]|uniref:acyl-CoA dehydrogenase n=1 Tax=Tomitella biformata TaxID=630403 RepID=UPI000467A7C5|nr:acyl-CoA dehydrogenase [Tomitella biformata]
MSHYRSNVRDLEFNLFEMLNLADVLESGEFGDLGPDTARTMLAEAARQAAGPLAESFADADRHPPTFDPTTHTVTLPDGYKASVRAWMEAGWLRVGLAAEVGGTPAPSMLAWALREFLVGAQPSAYMYLAGAPFADILHSIGNAQQRHWASMVLDRNWGATMALTEPEAGSDVGAARTKAIAQDDGTWHIEGVKHFITSGDSDDLFENIFHQVLARPVGAEPGTKGLSLFLVPKFLFDSQTGEPGQRNGVFVTDLEHKMGLRASATCELTFGAHGIPATGYLVGDSHAGIKQMFKVIEEARMMVGTKAIATLSTGYLNALAYAKTRIQGADLTRAADKNAPRVSITNHPDVRRSLLLQKSYAEGLRALYLYTAAHQDDAVALRVSGADPELAHKVNDLLLPIVKGVGSERAYSCLTESLQTLGGSGYLSDYPLEQYVRDSKIDSLYEGTTAIQAQDFFFRKIIRDRGVALAHLAGQVRLTVEAEDGNGRLKVERTRLGAALDDVQTMAATLTGFLMGAQERPAELYKVGLGSVRFLMSVGDLLIGWLLVRQAERAQAALDAGAVTDKDRAFYEGKLAIATFFTRNVLPELSATREILADLDIAAMELDESAF